MGSSAPPANESAPPANESFRGLLAWVWKEGKSLVALAAVLVYAVTRFAHDTFYARLGLTPEAVGLTEATILARAALYFSVSLVRVLVLFGLCWAIVSLFRRTSVLRSWRVPQENIPLLHGLLAALLMILIVLPGILVLSDKKPLQWLGYGYIFDFLTSSMLRGFLSLSSWIMVCLLIVYLIVITSRKSYNAWFLVLAIIAVGCFTAFSMIRLAQERGSSIADIIIEENEPLGPPPFAVLSLRAEPVCIIWPSIVTSSTPMDITSTWEPIMPDSLSMILF
jgi:hypothetical protein